VDRRGSCMSYSRMKGCDRRQAVEILRSIEPRLGGMGMFSRAGRFAAVSAALLTFATVQDAAAQQTVKIGAIYPLSGNAASAGGYSKAAIELAVDLVNNGNPNLKDVPLADGKGLPGLGGAKIEII